MECFFRPGNRFAAKVYGSVYRALGPEKCMDICYNYTEIPRLALPSTATKTEIARPDMAQELFKFAAEVRGYPYAIAEELDQDDLFLDALDQRYGKAGLRRYRTIHVAHPKGSDAISGLILAYRGPLGLNFSFLENRCEILLAPNLSETQSYDTLCALLNAAAPTYTDFPLGKMLVLADDRVASFMPGIGGIPIRQYKRCIWIRSGFEDWYHHVAKLYSNIFRRGGRRGLAHNSDAFEPSSIFSQAYPRAN